MALDTFERSAPPIFRQGLSTTTKLVLLSLLSLMLMAADHRLQISQPLRAGVAFALSPLQWLSLQPSRLWDVMGNYLSGVESARDAALSYEARTIAQAQRLQQVEQLSLENTNLRQLLELRSNIAGPSKAVEVLYDTADPYSRRVVVDRGQLAGIVTGSAVIDAAGVVGQVTRVYPLVSEVTLLTDRQQNIPVINARSGSRHVASGSPMSAGGPIELKFVPSGTDMQKGDLLTTSGIDGIYPPGLHVGRITQIDRRVDGSFATVHAEPTASERGRHLLVLLPFKDWPAKPVADKAQDAKGKASNKGAQSNKTGAKP
ncbi:MAG: Cell shape-determining protein MreC [Pseudomonadota bacterium]|jgi:rod shape-determining protein MreC